MSTAGNVAATSVTVTDALPAALAFGEASATQGSCALASGTLTCELGSLSPGGSATITIHVTAPATGGVVGNRATATPAETDLDPASNTGAVDVPICPPGDTNGDGGLNVADVFYSINDLFAGGPPPVG